MRARLNALNGFTVVYGRFLLILQLNRLQERGPNGNETNVDVGKTACKVPVAYDYIVKIEKAGRAGKKRKTIRC